MSDEFWSFVKTLVCFIKAYWFIYNKELSAWNVVRYNFILRLYSLSKTHLEFSYSGEKLFKLKWILLCPYLLNFGSYMMF